LSLLISSNQSNFSLLKADREMRVVQIPINFFLLNPKFRRIYFLLDVVQILQQDFELVFRYIDLPNEIAINSGL